MSIVPKLERRASRLQRSAYVAESIEALLGQTFEDFELIISDNASTDDTGDICRRYEKLDSRVRYFRRPRNVGLAPNHNFCVERAEGELFKWAASDDLYAGTCWRSASPRSTNIHRWFSPIRSPR